jgi:hypothetical protein
MEDTIMKKLFTQTLEAMKGAIDAIRNRAGNMEARASILRDMHWGEEGALKRILPLVTEAGNIAMSGSSLQDMLESCGTLVGLESYSSRVKDLRARIAFLEDSLLQEEEEAKGRLQAIMTRLQ